MNSRMITGAFSIGKMTITPVNGGNQVDGDEQVTLAAGSTVAGVVGDESKSGGNFSKGSEIAQALTGGYMTTDKDGNLVYADGRIHTKARVGSLKPDYANEQDLLDDAADLAFPNEIRVDGQLHHIGMKPATFYGSRPDGRLAHMDGPTAGTPEVTIPTTPTGVTTATVNPPASGQCIIIMSGDDWTLTLPNQPAPKVAGRTGFLRVVEIAGKPDPSGNVQVQVDGVAQYTESANGFGYTYGTGPSDAPFTVPVGSTLTLTGHGDARVDYRTCAYG